MFENVSGGAVRLILLSVVVVMAIGIGITAYFTKRTKTSQDWAIGGRKVPMIVLVFTMFATQVGGGVLVGHVGIGYQFGLAPIAYGICGVVGLLLMMLIAGWLRDNNFVTIPDIFRKLYGENTFLSIVSSIMAWWSPSAGSPPSAFLLINFSPRSPASTAQS